VDLCADENDRLEVAGLPPAARAGVQHAGLVRAARLMGLERQGQQGGQQGGEQGAQQGVQQGAQQGAQQGGQGGQEGLQSWGLRVAALDALCGGELAGGAAGD
jgi:hypothetical protein